MGQEDRVDEFTEHQIGSSATKRWSRMINHPNLVSAVCCIYHKPKKFDESSDESDSDASSCGSDDSTRPHSHNHSHNHSHSHPHSHSNAHSPAPVHPARGSGTELEPPSQPVPPNAYERQPNNSNKGKSKGEHLSSPPLQSLELSISCMTVKTWSLTQRPTFAAAGGN